LKLNKNQKFIIAVDGGSSVGKSTGAKLISKKYKLNFLSSGLLYRYASHQLLQKKPKNKIKFLNGILNKLNYKKLNSFNLHSPRISEYTSIIAKQNKIRAILKKFQVNFSKKNIRCVIEGRDIATKICPDADVKFFFICSLQKAAKRRFLDLKKKNPNLKFRDVKNALKIRNLRDKNRKHSPLLKHRDALVIDTGKLSKSGTVKKMSLTVDKEINKKYGSRSTN
tara:strand:- start:338 stop:1009 length:672 start_codon:yes stop_codon:yes gene_type:complete